MKIKWFGHAAFLLTAQDGTKIITDPYKPGCFNGQLSYQPIHESADIVTVSHEHEDHNYAIQISGKPFVLRDIGSKTIKNIKIYGITTCHDTAQGRERGLNTVYIFAIDGLRVCHLGDLGAILAAEEIKQIDKIDVLLIPVGGIFTIDAKTAMEVVETLQPKLVIPMHYKTSDCEFPIAPVDDFLTMAGKKFTIKRVATSEIEVSTSTLPKTTEIWVLKY